jgi:ubiquinone/menaquinone biosynthesis C-methylase UbiE
VVIETHLLDSVEKHVERAKLRVSAGVGDARRLDWPDRFADAVLLLGPLYHLTEQSDRHTALREVRRVLKARRCACGGRDQSLRVFARRLAPRVYK